MANLDAGNFRLVPRVRVEATTAINYDVMVEHSFKDVGSIAVSPDAQQIVPPCQRADRQPLRLRSRVAADR
ncbi:hypothetical protein [Gemmatimonas sp.]|uniref:hypothetical protein n=1 Tax=Gemmatimonas sp. TaxID=1962908 RepID=UPI003F6FAA51